MSRRRYDLLVRDRDRGQTFTVRHVIGDPGDHAGAAREWLADHPQRAVLEVIAWRYSAGPGEVIHAGGVIDVNP